MSSSPTLKFQKLQPADAPAYREMRLKSLRDFPLAFCADFARQQELPRLFLEEKILAQDPEKWVMGAFDENQLVGICGFARMEKPRLRHRGEIIQMYVRPGYAGKKVGLRLIQATVETAFANPDIQQIVLEVHTGLPAPNRVYEQAGFREIGYHPRYFRDGDEWGDLRIMLRERD